MIAVDDHLPLVRIEDTKNYKFLGANSLNAETWVILLEKAYAKAYGGYDRIGNGGDMRHALTDLTGAPSETFFLSEFEKDCEISGSNQIPYFNSNENSNNNSFTNFNDANDNGYNRTETQRYGEEEEAKPAVQAKHFSN